MPFPPPLLCTPSWGQAGEATRHYVSASPLLLQTPPGSREVQLRAGSPNVSIKLEEVSDSFFLLLLTALVALQHYDIIAASSKQ